MKKCLLVLTFTCSLVALFAQSNQQQKNDSICSLVKKYFNQKDSDALYALAGVNFKKALTPEAFRNVCNNNLFPLGEIKQTTFESYDNGISKYKAEFAPVNLVLLIGLDKEDKLETLLFQPYVDSKATRE